MQLSVVIVNYHVKYFLEQALHAVRKACLGLNAEVFVVDNNSVDGSCEMVKTLFPEVLLIENGGLSENGKHLDLRKQGSKYYNLFKDQLELN